MANYKLTSVLKIIEDAFSLVDNGNLHKNCIDFNMIRLVLILLARELNILHRQFPVKISKDSPVPSSHFAVTEVKLTTRSVPRLSELANAKKTSANGPKVHTKLKEGNESQNNIKSVISISDKTKNARNTDGPTTSTSLSTDSKTSNESFDSLQSTESKNEKKSKKKYRFHIRNESSNDLDHKESSEEYFQNNGKRRKEVRERLLIVHKSRPGTNIDTTEKIIEEYLKPKSLATEEEFVNLCEEVIMLLPKFSPVDLPELEEMLENGFYKDTTLNDPMAVLQLSARLEVLEKAIINIQNIALSANIENKNDEKSELEIERSKDIYEKETPTTSEWFGSKNPKETEQLKQFAKISFGKTVLEGKYPTINLNKFEYEYQIDQDDSTSLSKSILSDKAATAYEELITQKELLDAIDEFRSDAQKSIHNIGPIIALKKINNLFQKQCSMLERSSSFSEKMNTVESLKDTYFNKINLMDVHFSRLMTSTQESLNTMLHEVETAKAIMIENIAQLNENREAENLNDKLGSLQIDVYTMVYNQKKLESKEEKFIKEALLLSKTLDDLSKTKADREAVKYLMVTKAGSKDYNNFLTRQVFEGITNKLHEQISAMYSKFERHEYIWDKMLFDAQREFATRATKTQVQALRKDIDNNLKKLRKKFDYLAEILECDLISKNDQMHATEKRIYQNPCISCTNEQEVTVETHLPIAKPLDLKHMIKKERSTVPTNHVKTSSSENKICYHGLPIHHKNKKISRSCSKLCCKTQTLVLDTSSLPQLPSSDMVVVMPIKSNMVSTRKSVQKSKE